MATLTEVSFHTRRIIKWGAVGLVIVMLMPAAWRIIKTIYLTLNPPPPAAPTVKYGKLPKLLWPEADPNYKPQYRLETIEGGLPKLANVAKVYFVSINKSRILELERIKSRAAALGFAGDPEKANDQTYVFKHPTNPATLTVDIIYNSYKYIYDWRSDAKILEEKALPNNEQAVSETKTLWQNLGLLADDLTNGRPKVTYLKLSGENLGTALALSEADFVRVDLFRADKDEVKIVTPGGDVSPVNVIFSGTTDQGKRIVEANYAYSRILDDTFSTYPLKTSDDAWQELQGGGGYIAKMAANNVVIRKVTLAYYESGQPQEFLQPVYVFEGDAGFMAYVSAVSADYSQ